MSSHCSSFHHQSIRSTPSIRTTFRTMLASSTSLALRRLACRPVVAQTARRTATTAAHSSGTASPSSAVARGVALAAGVALAGWTVLPREEKVGIFLDYSVYIHTYDCHAGVLQCLTSHTVVTAYYRYGCIYVENPKPLWLGRQDQTSRRQVCHLLAPLHHDSLWTTGCRQGYTRTQD